MPGVGLIFISLVKDVSALGFRAQQRKSSSKTLGKILQLMKFRPNFTKASVLDKTSRRICIFWFGRSRSRQELQIGASIYTMCEYSERSWF